MIETVKILPLFSDVKTPEYAKSGDSGFDIIVHSFKKMFDSKNREIGIYNNQVIQLFMPPLSRLLVGTGYKISMPKGVELQIRSRSGKTLESGLIVLNSPGTVDSGYRGEIGAILCNNTDIGITVSLGDKVAQGVFVPVIRARWDIVKELDETDRGEGGFGSTDLKVKV